MIKPTLRRGETITEIKFKELPAATQMHINRVKSDRRFNRIFIPIASAFTGFGGYVGLHPKHAIAGAVAGALAGVVTSVISTRREDKLKPIAIQLSKQRKIQATAKLRGATHFKVDWRGNVHFIRAPADLKGKAFRPLFARQRQPVE